MTAQVVVTVAGIVLAVAVNVWFFAPARRRNARSAHAGTRGERAGAARRAV